MKKMNYIILFVLAVICTSVNGDGDHPHDHPHENLHTAESQTSSGDGVAQAISTSINDGTLSQANIPELLRSFNIQVPTSANSGSASSGGYHYPSPPTPGNPYPPPSFQIPPTPGFLPKILPFPAIIPYVPIIEKVILIVGGGLLLLVFLACLKLAVEKGGFLHAIGSSLANGFSGTDMGSIHGSVDASAGLSKNADMSVQQQQRVFNGVDRRF